MAVSLTHLDKLLKKPEAKPKTLGGYPVSAGLSNDPIHYGTHKEAGVYDIGGNALKSMGKTVEEVARDLASKGFIAAARRKGERGITNDHVHFVDPRWATKEAARLTAQAKTNKGVFLPSTATKSDPASGKLAILDKLVTGKKAAPATKPAVQVKTPIDWSQFGVQPSEAATSSAVEMGAIPQGVYESPVPHISEMVSAPKPKPQPTGVDWAGLQRVPGDEEIARRFQELLPVTEPLGSPFLTENYDARRMMSRPFEVAGKAAGWVALEVLRNAPPPFGTWNLRGQTPTSGPPQTDTEQVARSLGEAVGQVGMFVAPGGAPMALIGMGGAALGSTPEGKMGASAILEDRLHAWFTKEGLSDPADVGPKLLDLLIGLHGANQVRKAAKGEFPSQYRAKAEAAVKKALDGDMEGGFVLFRQAVKQVPEYRHIAKDDAQMRLLFGLSVERIRMTQPRQTVQQVPPALPGRVEPDMNVVRKINDDFARQQAEAVPFVERAPVVPDVPAAATPRTRTGVVPVVSFQPARMEKMGDVDFEPERFQFKESNPPGSTPYNAQWAGSVDVWRDPADGRLKVVDGHRRYRWAERDQEDAISVIEVEGLADAEEARLYGALKNITQGSGTGTDAARLFRTPGLSAEELLQHGVDLKAGVARLGMGIAKLNEDLFHQVATDRLSEKRGALIGELIPDANDQSVLLARIRELEQNGKVVSDAALNELINSVRVGQVAGGEQTGFGFITEESLDRANLAAYLISELEKNSKTLVRAIKERARLELGGNKIDAATSERIAKEAQQIGEVVTQTRNQPGAVGDILNEGARRLSNGEETDRVRADVYRRVAETVSSAIVRGDLKGLYGSGARPAAPPKAKDTPKPVAKKKAAPKSEPKPTEPAPAKADTADVAKYADDVERQILANPEMQAARRQHAHRWATDVIPLDKANTRLNDAVMHVLFDRGVIKSEATSGTRVSRGWLNKQTLPAAKYGANAEVASLVPMRQSIELANKSNLGPDEYLRWSEVELQPGETLKPSRRWDDNKPTSELLPGTSAIDPRAQFSAYDLDHGGYVGSVYVVKGRKVGTGEDAGEVMLADATVARRLASAKAETATPAEQAAIDVPAGEKPIASAADFEQAWIDTKRFNAEEAAAMRALAEGNRAYLGWTEDYYYPKLWKRITGDGDPSLDALMQEMVPAFYSKLERVVTDKMSAKMPADQLTRMLEGAGVKPDELHWTGFDKWLREQDGPVTKQAALDFLAENQVQIKEVTKDTPIVGEDMPPGMSATKFHDYTLPGGENYRELLLTLPERADHRVAIVAGGKYAGFSDVFGQVTPEFATREQALEYLRDYERSLGSDAGNYKSPHWDEPNVIAHIRFNDRVTSADGTSYTPPQKTLHIEEIQSDWHQAGRQNGYKGQSEELGRLVYQEEQLAKQQDSLAIANREALQAFADSAKTRQQRDSLLESVHDIEARQVELANQRDALRARIADLQFADSKGVPAAPFSKSWPDLAMKRMLRYAAENGYERITWTKGIEQVKRYEDSLRTAVDKVEWTEPDSSGEKFVRAYKNDEVVFKGTIGDDGIFRDYEAGGKSVTEVLGKELGGRILAEPGGSASGSDLTIGGEGMKGFYDQILPSIANKLTKKWGGKVGESSVFTHQPEPMEEFTEHYRRIWHPDATAEDLARAYKNYGQGAREPVHSLTITPSMKSALLNEGQPLFQKQETPRTLIAVHNTSAEGIAAAAELGGIPAPSLAISKPDISPNSFGSISLVGDRRMVDPHADASTRVFESDIYSDTQPHPYHDQNKTGVKSLAERINKQNAAQDVIGYKAYGLEDYGESYKGEGSKAKWIEDAMSTTGRAGLVLRTTFLRDEGITVKVPKKTTGNDYEIGRPDTWAYAHETLPGVWKPTFDAQYEAFVRATANDIFTNAHLKIGTKKVAYNLYTVTDAMTKGGIRAKQSTMFETLARSRAKNARELKSVEAMHRAEKTIVSHDEMAAFIDATNQEFFGFVDAIRDAYKWQAQPFGALDDASKAIADYIKAGRTEASMRSALRKNDFNAADLPDEAIRQGMDVAHRLMSSPTEYFEAKLRRPVPLKDFAAAVVPADTPKATLDTLKRSGVKRIVTYDKNSPGDRQAKIKELTDLLFQQQEGKAKGSTEFAEDGAAIIRAFENADISTGVHEMAHVFRRHLKDEDRAIVERVYKIKGEWTRKDEERFARGFERYLRDGKAPTPELKSVFEKFKEWLTAIYESIKDTVLNAKIPDEVRAVYDRLLGGKGQETIKEPAGEAKYTQPYHIEHALGSPIRPKANEKPVEGGLFGDAPTQQTLGGVDALLDDAASRATEAIPPAPPLTPGLGVQVVAGTGGRKKQAKYKSEDPEIEEAFESTREGVKPSHWTDAVREGLVDLWHAGTRTHKDLPRGKRFAVANEELRNLSHQKSVASNKTLRLLQDVTLPLTNANQFDVFRRKVVLDDLAESAAREEPLPFGFTREQVEAELGRVNAVVDADPGIKTAMERRKAAWEAIKTDYAAALKEVGFDVSDRLSRESYFRHQVLDHMEAKRLAGTGKKLQTPAGRGFLKTREGSAKAISTNYLQAEWEVMAQMLYDTEVAKSLKVLEDEYDVSAALKETARKRNYTAIVGGPENLARLNELRTEKSMIAGDGEEPLDSGDKGRLKEINDEIWELDPTMPYKQQIAIGFAKLEKMELLDEYDGDLSDGLFAKLARLYKTNEEARGPVGQIFKAIADKDQMMKDKLGPEYLTWKHTIDDRLLDDTLGKWQPREGNVFFRAKSLPEKAVEELLAGLGVTPEQLTDVMVLGGRRKEWVIPVELAATLDRAGTQITKEPYQQLHSKMLVAWKMHVLLNPRRWFKYNLRNTTGDAEPVLVAMPEAFREVVPTVRELYEVFRTTRTPTGAVADFMEMGGPQGLLQAQEMGQVDQLGAFLRLVDKKPGIKDAAFGYWKGARLSTDFRESILRVAAYKVFLRQIMADPQGRPKTFGASIPEEVMAIKDPKRRAFKLQNELLGAYDQITELGRWMRGNAYPFWSWVEINFGRNVRLMKNAAREGRAGRAGAVGAAKAGLGYVRFAVMASTLWAALQAYNNLRFPEEEKDLPKDVRARPHLIFGRNKDGTVNYIGRLGAFSDFLEWFGANAAPEAVSDFLNGRRSIKEILQDAAKQPVNKIVQGLHPLWKMGTELTTGRKLFPDVFKPGRIRDKADYLAQQFSLENEFRALTGRPSAPYTGTLTKAFANQADPEQTAYYEIMDRKFRFLESHNKYSGESSNNPKSLALWNYKRALVLGDKAATKKYAKMYADAGGTKQGMAQSIRASNPLFGLGSLTQSFVASLTPEEKRQLTLATKYYARFSK